MAIIRKNELNTMEEVKLKAKLNDLRQEMIKINAQRSTSTPPENPGRVKEVRRTIAKILAKLNSPVKVEEKKIEKKEIKETKEVKK